MNTTPETDLREREIALLESAQDGQTTTSVQLFQDLILYYYRHFGRDLPWRHTADPYHILVSEIMLQQTQVERVVPKYTAFLEAFPSIDALAAAPLPDLLMVWSGLGYNRRAISLQTTAVMLRDEYNGIIPADPEELRRLPGIGKATAAAICAYAFNMPVVYIETNIRQLIIHYFFQGADDIPDTALVPVLEKALYRDAPRDFYSGMMDYGTDLRKRRKNQNTRSRHYHRQAPFAGSDREIRGEILRLLLKQKEMPGDLLFTSCNADPVRVQRIVCDLEKEGFVRLDAGVYTIRDDTRVSDILQRDNILDSRQLPDH
ncbi:A/G-specific adenine glycosylase [Methanocalculus natronophilus]|uniref:A/G-specific adenine glycosylase n=2 Tax=Methanocalculus TaxID=71151 RepID=UPI0031B61DFB